MDRELRPHAPPQRVLLGPGPSELAPGVALALLRPTLGHLDPEFLALMDEVRALLRGAFRTTNELAFPMSGTGTASGKWRPNISPVDTIFGSVSIAAELNRLLLASARASTGR